MRLPAEITLPHDDYPRPTIFSLASSYHHGDVAFPGTSPPAPPDPPQRPPRQHVPHPRPLFLDKPLVTLSKEDPAAYTAFLEGASLLAYDIVWLCRTQGVPVGDNINSLEDYCMLGRNLYNLLVGSCLQRTQPAQQLIPEPAVPTFGASAFTAGNGGSGDGGDGCDGGNGGDDGGHGGSGATADPAELARAGPRMGLYSHGTAHTFLGSAAGGELTRAFKLLNPIKLADRLRASLANESSLPEWELLEADAFTPDDALDDGVLVGGAAPKRGGGLAPGAPFGLESYISVATVRNGGAAGAQTGRISSDASAAAQDRDVEREKGTSGWTRVKPR